MTDSLYSKVTTWAWKWKSDNITPALSSLPGAKGRVLTRFNLPTEEVADEFVKQARKVTAKNLTSYGVGAASGIGTHIGLKKVAKKLNDKKPDSKFSKILSNKGVRTIASAATAIGTTLLTRKITGAKGSAEKLWNMVSI